MNSSTDLTKRLTDPKQEETLHLFDADAREEKALCEADAYAEDLMTVQYCPTQLIRGVPVGNACRTCMDLAACWAEEHCRKLQAEAMLLRSKAQRLHERDATRFRDVVEEADLEADRLLEQAREYRRAADRLAGDTRPTVHVWAYFALLHMCQGSPDASLPLHPNHVPFMSYIPEGMGMAPNLTEAGTAVQNLACHDRARKSRDSVSPERTTITLRT